MKGHKSELLVGYKLFPLPQLLVNLKLLTMPTLELEALVRAELEKNPVLEETSEEPENEEQPAKTDDFDFSDFLQEDLFVPRTPATETDFDPIDLAVEEPLGLADIVLPQARKLLPVEDWPILEYIVKNLTEDGFLTIAKEEIKQEFTIVDARLDGILKTLQHLDPVGMATSGVKESLLVQLQAQGSGPDTIEYRIVNECYDLLDKKSAKQIARIVKGSEEKVKAALENLRTLNPKPGREYSKFKTNYVYPDFFVEWRENSLIASLNDNIVPNIRISPRYREILLNPKAFSAEEVAFARERARNTILLIEGIERRKNTLRRLISFLLKEQAAFFKHGAEHIKPLDMGAAAQALSLHLSTISRAVKGKYVETPFGIFELHFFFSKGIGDNTQVQIQQQLKELIDGEDKSNPYSDDELAKKLSASGTPISRRTVAKYRAELRIPSQRHRKN
jgi:RNA polymerase sigma-54 factor